MNSKPGLREIHVRAGFPEFLELPWEAPLAEWRNHTSRLVDVPRGLSRHEVVFVSYGAAIYALKEMPPKSAQREYELLLRFEERHLPAVMPVGHALTFTVPGDGGLTSVLITRFEESTLPYRVLFLHRGLERYRERLLDAMAGLLVRLHLAGVYWGDCSLSNTLFRRDAGELQAFLVDAETSDMHETLSEGQRRQDLIIMEENVAGELADVAAQLSLPAGMDADETGPNIRRRYDRLWEEISREVAIHAGERYRIHERVRALNELGFTVSEVELIPAGEGNHLRMRTIVTDRDYHRRQLHTLTGIVAGDRQAAQMMNEINELRATLAEERGQSVPLSVAAYRWQTERYEPTVTRLATLEDSDHDAPELYCEVLEHKWFMSEKAQRDVGLDVALEDFVAHFGSAT